MTILESFRIAMRALARNKMRTALTMLGIIIGVSAVITLVALGTGATAMVTENITSLGTNLLFVFPGNPEMQHRGPGGGFGQKPTLTLEDAKVIARRLPQTVTAVAPVAMGQVAVKLGDQSHQTNITGTTPEYKDVNNTPVRSGRFITQMDVDGRVKVAVLGATVVEELLGSPDADPVGMNILINRSSFKVIGVLKEKGSSFGQDQDDTIVIPISTALRRVFNRDFVNMINVEVVSQDSMSLASEQVSRLLRQRHRLRPPFPDNDDFMIHTQTGLLETFQVVFGAMTGLLAGIAVVSLVVGGIGIMNIMLVSVSERTREIGLRKAVGATNRDILWQFLIESSVIAAAGGLFGVALGAAGSQAMAKVLKISAIVSPSAVLLAVGVATAIGLFFGIYPARKASKLDPIEALRYE